VRAWVEAHPAADIAALSTANKLKAIKTLMGGWISDADADAIGQICGGVTTRAEADAIRNGVDLTDIGLSHRSTVRAFFLKMP
jgi:hypothetical protein